MGSFKGLCVVSSFLAFLCLSGCAVENLPVLSDSQSADFIAAVQSLQLIQDGVVDARPQSQNSEVDTPRKKVADKLKAAQCQVVISQVTPKDEHGAGVHFPLEVKGDSCPMGLSQRYESFPVVHQGNRYGVRVEFRSNYEAKDPQLIELVDISMFDFRGMVEGTLDIDQANMRASGSGTLRSAGEITSSHYGRVLVEIGADASLKATQTEAHVSMDARARFTFKDFIAEIRRSDRITFTEAGMKEEQKFTLNGVEMTEENYIAVFKPGISVLLDESEIDLFDDIGLGAEVHLDSRGHQLATYAHEANRGMYGFASFIKPALFTDYELNLKK